MATTKNEQGTRGCHSESAESACFSPLTIADWQVLQADTPSPRHVLAVAETALSDDDSNAWISIATEEQIREQWETISAARSKGHSLPLFGVPFAVKDNIDVAGFHTTAACTKFSQQRAHTDATVVARLKARGAIVVGKTNLDQFATGLVGTRSPYGAVQNPFDASRVSGGSSSGSAVVVSRGLVPFALGTDTAGSGRVPAGLNNIVGLKPTRGALSTTGVLPACRSLDCVSILALTLEDAALVLQLAEGHDVTDAYSRQRPESGTPSPSPSKQMIAIPANPHWFGCEARASAYDQALLKAQKLGWTVEEVDFSLLDQLATLLYEGPWVAERYAAIAPFIRSSSIADFDPVVHSIISKAKNFSAVDAFAYEYRRQELCSEIHRKFERFNAILVPTSPTFPTMDALEKDPVLENSRLGIYTNFVNFMDWTAIAIPAGFCQNMLPFGITLISTAWNEPHLLHLSQQWLSVAPRRLGVTAREHVDHWSTNPPLSGTFELAVVGAHLTGFPLNKDLTSRGATLQSSTTTAPKYRLYELQNTSPPKPGLERVHEGHAIELEVWDVPVSAMGSFMDTITAPLGIGSIELCDGRWVHGFICEPCGLQDAKDISNFGGWKSYKQNAASTVQVANVSLSMPARAKKLKRVLIANRGEIAVRIIRTLRSMGIFSVSIYSSLDSNAPHAKNADLSLLLVGETVVETYLNASQILELARQNDCDSVIPGYGFLSENADFATAVEAAGLTWIGPTPQQMNDMGLKHRAREIAQAAGVPTVPGSKGLVSDVEAAVTEAYGIGYPLMLKSTAGGGGIGLQQCADEPALRAAFESVSRLGQANFGNGSVFVERFIQHARHVEVQILGDGTGKVLCAGERDCSLQRRHQKVIEESPAVILPVAVRDAMRKAASNLASSVKYRNVGTVEFVYDIETSEFYFLEMNTRLQVEHPVTETVTGLDLVECMIKIAEEDAGILFTNQIEGTCEIKGASVEARIYAESPLQNFRPSHGRLLNVKFPSDVRVDTWISAGQQLSMSYDPMLAKVIVHGNDRSSAIAKLAKALSEIVITGVETNVSYLRQIVESEAFKSADFTTTTLNRFAYEAEAFEVIESGLQTTVQDYPGRKGFWHIGIPPSGPLDSYSFRLANRLVGNHENDAGLECYHQGPTLKFHCPSVVAVVGADCDVHVGVQRQTCGRPFLVESGQTVSVGQLKNCARVYVAIEGGIRVPRVMGSRSTFPAGELGGHNGRNLQVGDILAIKSRATELNEPFRGSAPPLPFPTPTSQVWSVGVIPGPHGSPAYLHPQGIQDLCTSEWRVHHNSNRLGVRLTGPRPEWARESGGEAGLHPSNIHDSPYAIGSVSFTGDEAIVLTGDGPSLGGFVVFATVVQAEMWKIGQMRPGDRLRFVPITLNTANKLMDDLKNSVSNLQSLESSSLTDDVPSAALSPGETVISVSGRYLSCRPAGDGAVLVVFGEKDGFDLEQTFHILAFVKQQQRSPMPGVEQLTTGVCSVLLSLDKQVSYSQIIETVRQHEESLGEILETKLPSRIIKMPLAFDDQQSQAAIARYQSTIRSSAPYLPSNIEFLSELNGLDGIDAISDILCTASFLVLGLGDVYKGSPCAIALDPRHRLFGTKYNPSRSFTPAGTVGIAGQYLCIYAMDSPGGYQMVGRTVPIWDQVKEANWGESFEVPWMFQLLDQIVFFPMTESDLVAAESAGKAADLVQITETELDLDIYKKWIAKEATDIRQVKKSREAAIKLFPALDQLLLPDETTVVERSDEHGAYSDTDTPGEFLRAQLPGKCFKVCVQEGDNVQKGDVMVCIEANKMEVQICATVSGICQRILIKKGQIVGPDERLAFIEVAG